MEPAGVATELTFLGAAGFEVSGPRHRILIDPFLRGNPLAPAAPAAVEAPDVILVTHAAFDHLGDTAEIALRTGSPVVCGGDVRLKLLDDGVPDSQIRATVWGVVVEVGGVVVRPVECHHWSMTTLSDGRPVTGTPLAFIFETEPGVRIYHYGDTCLFDMRLIGELYAPTVGLLGCTDPHEINEEGPAGRILTGEMTPDEAARAAEMLGVRWAIGCHYIAPNDEVREFPAAVARHDSTGSRLALTPSVGETVTIDAASVGAPVGQSL
jgi:L-ascorbate metabolism protein UlaG (beta-lactamase superfamily)